MGSTLPSPALARRASLPVTVSGSAQRRVPEAIELAAYFFVSEALTNVVKQPPAHEGLGSEASEAGHALRVTVRDDGAGGACICEGGGLAGLQGSARLFRRNAVGRQPGRAREPALQAGVPLRVVIADDAVLLREGVALSAC